MQTTLSVKETAALLGKAKKTIYGLIDDGVLERVPAPVLEKKKKGKPEVWHITRSSIDHYLTTLAVLRQLGRKKYPKNFSPTP